MMLHEADARRLVTAAAVALAAHAVGFVIVASASHRSFSPRVAQGGPLRLHLESVSIADALDAPGRAPLDADVPARVTPAPIDRLDIDSPQRHAPPPAAVARTTTSAPLDRFDAAAYYPDRMLDRQPEPIAAVEPDDMGRVSHASTIVLTLFISASGAVDHAEIDPATTVTDDRVRDRAVEAFSSIHYRPALRDGAPVNARITVEIEFDGPPLSSEIRR